MKTLLSAILAIAAFSSLADAQPYERYESIVNRLMFGPLPPDFDPARDPSQASRGGSSKKGKELSQEQEKIKQTVSFSVLDVRPDGTIKVGFTDKTDAKAPKSYYLAVGESSGDWLVKDADAENGTMTILNRKNNVELELEIGSGAPRTSSSAEAKNGAAPRTGSGLLGGSQFLTRRARRQAALEASQKEAEKLREELAEQEAQRQKDNEENEARRRAEQEENRKSLQALRDEVRKKLRESARGGGEDKGEGNGEDESE